MKSILPLFLIVASPSLHAATVTFGFEASNAGASLSGSGFSSTNLSEMGISTGAIYGQLTGGGSPPDTTIVRVIRPDQTAGSAVLTTDYFEFTLTPDAGQALDLSAAAISFRLAGVVGFYPNNGVNASARAGYSVNGGAFTALGAANTTVFVNPFATAAPNWTGAAGFNSTADQFDLAETTATIPLSALPALAIGDTITFRLGVGDDSGVTRPLDSAPSATPSTGTGDSIKAIYVDDITVSGFNVVPEPSAIILSGIGVAVLAFRRRL